MRPAASAEDARPRVDAPAADRLAASAGGRISAVELRECLEYEPVAAAERLLAAALRSDPERPFRPLLRWAVRRRRGHHRPPRLKPSFEEERAALLAFHRQRSRELGERRGYGALPSEHEEFAREFYAPGYRAALRMGRPASQAPNRRAA